MIPLFIPFVNRFDLLEKAVRSVGCKDVEINIINNSGGASIGVPGVDFIQRRPPVPLTFSQTQNWMLDIASGGSDYEDFYLFMHADAAAERGTVQRLVDMARDLVKTGRKWGAIFTAYDSLAAFNIEAFQTIGGWDTNLTWYLGDCDCYRRLRLAGYGTIDSGLPVEHTPSQTLNSDRSIARAVSIEVPFREAYYRAKWGGPNEEEVYLTPFNR